MPTFNNAFWGFVIGASVMQILATGLMVKLFKMNNYAIGAGLAKSEALVAAILGVLFFGSALSLLGWLGVFLGAIAVLLLSGITSVKHFDAKAIAVLLLSGITSVKHFDAKTALLGLACGTSFALTSLWVREASLNSGLLFPPSLNSGLLFPHSAAWVLLFVISLQTLILLGYLLLKEPHTVGKLWQYKGITTAISVFSCVGSIGWFSAMSLQHVAYVKTLGQVEVFFTMLIAVLWLKQPLKKQDTAGLILIAIAAILVMLPN